MLIQTHKPLLCPEIQFSFSELFLFCGCKISFPALGGNFPDICVSIRPATHEIILSHTHTYTSCVTQGLPYGFASYVLLARSYLVPSPLGSPPQSKKRRKEGGEETAVSSVRGDAMATLSSSCVFHNQEYEVFQEVRNKVYGVAKNFTFAIFRY